MSETIKGSSSFANASTLSLSLTKSNSRITTFDELKLSHILNGETCPPISFPDFASFITHKEFSAENLLFVIWFRSYRARFEALPDKAKWATPVPSTKLGDRYRPFAYLDKALAEGKVASRSASLDVAGMAGSPAEGVAFNGEDIERHLHFDPNEFRPCAWTIEGKACNCGKHTHKHGEGAKKGVNWSQRVFGGSSGASDETVKGEETLVNVRPIIHSSMHPLLPPPGTMLLDPPRQPMRAEAERAFATFLRKGGSRELGISDDLRQFAKDTLKRSTAPECFLPIYEEVFHVVETQSLPHFLGYAKTNVNRPKQLFWYYVGFTDFMIGVLIFVLITLFVPQYHFGYRAARIPAALFTCFGSMQFYSAARGFCTQVWGRASRQIRPWEMDDVDEEHALGMKKVDDDETQQVGGEGRRLTAASIRTVGDEKAGEGRLAKGVVSGLHEKEEKDAEKMEMPLHGELEITLADEVHPLADLSGITTSPVNETVPELPWQTPVREGTDNGDSRQSIDASSLNEAQLRQLSIRRDTIKVPSPELAFPIMDSPVAAANASVPYVSTSPIMDQRKRSEILPFEDIVESTLLPIADCESPRFTVPSQLGKQGQSGPTIVAEPASRKRIPADLGQLMSKFRRGEPLDPEHFKSTEKEREKKTKIFGPERLVEDPRVKALMDKIVRDILIVGGVVALVTIGLCFAVPMRL